MSIVFKNVRGPFQNNGASPWYSLLDMGTPPQTMKINIDSGTNITWVTSTLCPTDSCIHAGGDRFDVEASTTFNFTDCLERPFSFGKWGTMQVMSGTDVIALPGDNTIPAKLFLATHYEGDQFEQLNWDGGIGLPSSSAFVEGRSTFMVQEMMIAGLIDREMPYVAFDHDVTTNEGTCEMGGYDEALTSEGGLFIPWSVYDAYSGVEYLWSSKLASMKFGEVEIGAGKNFIFAADTGASQFKGDDAIMNRALAEIAAQGNPLLTLTFEDGGQILMPPDFYNVLIEAGPDAGKVIPQFEPLGMDRLVLVGNILLDYLYTVFQYEVVECSPTVVSLAPVGVWLFNKPNSRHKLVNGTKRLPGRIKPKSGRTAFGPSRTASDGEAK